MIKVDNVNSVFEDKDSFIGNIQKYEVPILVCDCTSESFPNNTMPWRAECFIHIRLYFYLNR